MRLFIDEKVHRAIDNFYDVSVLLHYNTLSYETVMSKKQRLYNGIRTLSDMSGVYAKARLKQEWIDAGWREFICEDFHFAYEVCDDEFGVPYIWVHDAVHSLLYR